MTYLELLNKATNLLDANRITIGECEKMIQPLHRQVLPDFITQWTPVMKRMPEQSSTVLITVKSRDYSKKESWIYFTDVATYYGFNGIDWEMFNDWDEGQEYYITAWMPLPQPWKGADDD